MILSELYQKKDTPLIFNNICIEKADFHIQLHMVGLSVYHAPS